MDIDFDATSKKECSICLYDLHFSAAGCPCSADRYSCLNHAKQFCSCAWTEKIFLFRHQISDLNILLEALEGRLSSVYKWAKENLGLSLNDLASKSIMQTHGQIVSPTSQVGKLRQTEHTFLDFAAHFGTSSSTFRIREEIKARMHQATISKKSKEKEIKTESPSITPYGTSNSASSIREELKARLNQATISKTLKAKEIKTASSNAAKSRVIDQSYAFCAKSDVHESAAQATNSNEPKAKENTKAPSANSSAKSIGRGTSFLQMDIATELSSASSSETSSSESDTDIGI